MKIILMTFVIVLAYNNLFSFPPKIENIYKTEVYKYDTTNASWRQISLTEYFWDNKILNHEIDYYVQKDSSKIESSRKIYQFNAFGYLTVIMTEELGDFYHEDSYIYDESNRLTDEISIASDSGALRYNYSYSPQSDSIISSVFLSRSHGTSAWDTLSLSLYDRDSSGLLGNDSTFSYNMISHSIYNGLKDIYLYDSLNNLIEKDNYSIGNSGYLLKSKIFYSYKDQKLSKIISSFYSNNAVIISNIINYSYNETGSILQIIDSGFSTGEYSANTVYDYDYKKNGDTTFVTEIQTKYNLDVINFKYKTVKYMFDNTASIGNADEKSGRFLIYPNPVTKAGLITLSLGDIDRKYVDVSLIDQSGRTVAKFVAQNLSGNLSFPCPDVPAGAYFIRVISDGKTASLGRIVVQ